MRKWKYYNHAVISTCEPHEIVDILPIKNKTIWKDWEVKGYPLIVRWTTDFDIKRETEWWYIIKDSPFDVSKLNAKRRYEITKGNLNFYTKKITPSTYSDELYEVTVDAFSAYPKDFRLNLDHEDFIEGVKKWDKYDVFAVFSKEDNILCGYALLQNLEGHIEFCVLKTRPQYEKKAVNAAIISYVLAHYETELSNGKYICDGERSILHETSFQDYLEKYFYFRKAYCKLHIKYRWWVGVVVKCIYPFRRMFYNKKSKICKMISSVLKMEEISKTFKKGDL